jgi:hypothetical protein
MPLEVVALIEMQAEWWQKFAGNLQVAVAICTLSLNPFREG